MTNKIIKEKISISNNELKKKVLETGYTVNETRLIVNRALELINDFKPNKEELWHKSETIRGLKFVLELADNYDKFYNDNIRRSSYTTHSVIVGAAQMTLEYFLRGNLLPND